MKAMIKRFILFISLLFTFAYFGCEGMGYKKDTTANEPSKALRKRAEKKFEQVKDTSEIFDRHVYDNR